MTSPKNNDDDNYRYLDKNFYPFSKERKKKLEVKAKANIHED